MNKHGVVGTGAEGERERQSWVSSIPSKSQGRAPSHRSWPEPKSRHHPGSPSLPITRQTSVKKKKKETDYLLYLFHLVSVCVIPIVKKFYISFITVNLLQNVFKFSCFKFRNQILLQSMFHGVPGWPSQLSVCLQLRSWSQGPGTEPHIRVPAQQRACFFFSLYLPLYLLVLSLSLCQINKLNL